MASTRSFKAIHLFRMLIIHDQLKTRAVNISDDTHEAIYQSRGKETDWFVGEMYSIQSLYFMTQHFSGMNEYLIENRMKVNMCTE